MSGFVEGAAPLCGRPRDARYGARKGLRHRDPSLAGIRRKSRGFTRIFLDSRESAIGYYRQVGFEFIKATPCWIDVAGL
jgi:hypothetical protein